MKEIIGNEEAAKYVGVSVNTWRPYVARKQAPPPDRREVQGGHAVPVWRKSTLDRWMRERPGQGVGGGRKPKEPAS